jgi:hypothetical protein
MFHSYLSSFFFTSLPVFPLLLSSRLTSPHYFLLNSLILSLLLLLLSCPLSTSPSFYFSTPRQQYPVQESEESLKRISAPFKPLIACYTNAVAKAVGHRGGQYIFTISIAPLSPFFLLLLK